MNVRCKAKIPNFCNPDFADCNLCCYGVAYENGRADAIDECLKIVKFHEENEWDGISWAVEELEELKEREK